jgi:hypothetical protein
VQQFSPEEVEIMAEHEHGRWNVERLLDGWKWGPIKDVANKISPYIIPWSGLPEEIKEYDRDVARQIPHVLEEVGGGRPNAYSEAQTVAAQACS